MNEISGLLPLSLVASFLHQPLRKMEALIEEDGLPAVNVPTDKKQVRKVPFLAFHKWLKKRSVNQALTVEELEEEMLRVARAAKAGRRQE